MLPVPWFGYAEVPGDPDPAAEGSKMQGLLNAQESGSAVVVGSDRLIVGRRSKGKSEGRPGGARLSLAVSILMLS